MSVTDGNISTLSKKLPSKTYHEVCSGLGKEVNEANGILEKHKNDYKASYHEVLIDWKNNILASERYNQLRTAMHNAGLGGLFEDVFNQNDV